MRVCGVFLILVIVSANIQSNNSLEITLCDICMTVVEVARQRSWEFDSYQQIMEYENQLCENVLDYNSECYDMVYKYLPTMLRYIEEFPPGPSYREMCESFEYCY